MLYNYDAGRFVIYNSVFVFIHIVYLQMLSIRRTVLLFLCGSCVKTVNSFVIYMKLTYYCSFSDCTRAADTLKDSYFEERVIYEFDSLVTDAARILKRKKRLKKFISELQSRYHDIKVGQQRTFEKILISISKAKENRYNITNYTRLFAILRFYAEEETKLMRERYADVVAGFHKVKQISECLRSRCEYAELKVVVERSVIYCIQLVTDEIMSDIRMFWVEISKRCRLPPLDLVIAYAERGSIRITWLIQTDRVTSRQIRDLLIQYLPRNVPFLQEHDIVLVMFNNEKIYSVRLLQSVPPCSIFVYFFVGCSGRSRFVPPSLHLGFWEDYCMSTVFLHGVIPTFYFIFALVTCHVYTLQMQ